jgi:ubiquinone/menaquinone biosynthesis C-methylase UbiE
MLNKIERRPHYVEWNGDKISEYWDVFGNIKPVSPWFSTKASGFILKELKSLKKKYLTSKDIKVLDIGTGSGDLLGKIHQELGFDCHGIDISTDRIEKARLTYPKLKFSKGAIINTGFDDKIFDIVISTQTIEHLLTEDLEFAFSEMSRVLKPGGIAFLTTRFEENLGERLKVCPDCLCIFSHSQHLQSFTQQSIENLFLKFGFTTIVNKKSLCRDSLKEFIPNSLKWVNFFVNPIFHKYMDKRLGKYLFAIGRKKNE